MSKTDIGPPNYKKMLPDVIAKNYGKWKYHEQLKTGVLRHVSESGDEVFTVRCGSPKLVCIDFIRDLCDIADVNGDLFGVANFGDADDFDLIVIQDADDSCSQSNPVINFGDHVMLALDTSSVFSSNSGIPPMTDVFGMVISEAGAPAIIGFKTPSSYADQVMELQ